MGGPLVERAIWHYCRGSGLAKKTLPPTRRAIFSSGSASFFAQPGVVPLRRWLQFGAVAEKRGGCFPAPRTFDLAMPKRDTMKTQQELEKAREVLSKAQADLPKRQAAVDEAKLILDEVVHRRPKVLAEQYSGGATTTSVIDREGVQAEEALAKAEKALEDHQAVINVLITAVQVAAQAVDDQSFAARQEAVGLITKDIAAVWSSSMKPLFGELVALNAYIPQGRRNDDQAGTPLLENIGVRIESLTGKFSGGFTQGKFYQAEIEKLNVA